MHASCTYVKGNWYTLHVVSYTVVTDIKVYDIYLLFHTGKGYVFTMAISAVSIELHHNLTETGVYYLCNLTHGNNLPASQIRVDKNVSTQVTNVTGLLPDTTYRVDCVAYNSTGVEVCLEVNTTVTTCELQCMHKWLKNTDITI